MKRIAVCFLSLILLCGCAKPAKDIKPVLSGISFTTKATFYNENYTFKTVIEKDFSSTFYFNKPKELSGLTVTLKDDNYKAYFNGLDYSGKISSSPLKGIVQNTYSFLKSAENGTVEKNDKEIYIKNSFGGTEFTLYITDSGLPIKLVCPDLGLNAEFYDLVLE